MSGDYRLTPKAEASFEAVGEYTEENRGVVQRNKYLDALVDRFSELAQAPNLGRRREQLQPGLRSYHEGHHIIFYKGESHGDIVIIDILHESMEPALHLKPKA